MGGGGCVWQGWCCLFFLRSLHRSPRQAPGDTLECWCSLSAFPAPSLLPQGVHLLLSCSHGLFLPRAKLILKVGQKGGKTIKRLRPPLLTHMGTAVSEPEPSPASSTATKGMSQSVGHHLTPRLSQQPHRKMTWGVWVMMTVKVNCVGRVMNACESSLPLEEPLRPQGASTSSKRSNCWKQAAG